MYNVCALSYNAANPLPCGDSDFKGGIYWDELAETCGDILRVAGFRDNNIIVI